MRRLSLLLALAVLVGCGGSKKAAPPPRSATTTPTSANGCRSVSAPAPRKNAGQKPPAHPLDPKKKYALVLQTNCGSFVIALDQTLAPHTAASLVSLARAGFYDRTIFHRIVPGFVIQGGDPTQTGAGGPGYKTVDRPPASARYVKGVVAMAKTQLERPGTSGSQFFVVTAADAGLTPDYAIVGRVTRGMSVVDRIGKLGDASEHPTRTVEIERVRITVS